MYRFRQHVCHPGHNLPSYTRPLTSLSTEFITHLVISGGCTFSTSEMLCLTEIKNLGVLEIIQPADELQMVFPQVTDRLIRGWTETENPFPLLRVLRIWGDRSTTQESLQWVSRFPSLALYDVMGSREDWTNPHEHALKAGWEPANPSAMKDDSLLGYLMLCVQSQEGYVQNGRNLVKTVDADLISLCSDSRCAIKFVEHGQAPGLLEYLSDAAKSYMPSWDMDAAVRDGRSCQGMAFEAWAFWLYSFLGQLSQDRDLKGSDVQPESQAVAGPFVLPSKPFASLFLGHSGRGGISSKPSYVSRGLFAVKRFTFTRPSAIREMEPKQTREVLKDEVPKKNTSQSTRKSTNPRQKKRMRLDDVLGSFMR